MELHRITLATAPSDISGETEYWLTEVREHEHLFGFEVLEGEQRNPHLKFLYATHDQAATARVLMFKILADAIAVTSELPVR